jgi:hypothetical protein
MYDRTEAISSEAFSLANLEEVIIQKPMARKKTLMCTWQNEDAVAFD